jgi:transposase
MRKEPVMEKGTTFVGLDVHKEAINVAMLLPGESSAVEWQTSNDPAAVRRLVRKVQRSAVGELRLCYEAGPCGYAVQRTLRAMGVSCIVVAPSLVPRRPGERVKTDRRDARKLAQLLRSGPPDDHRANGGAITAEPRALKPAVEPAACHGSRPLAVPLEAG